MMDLAVDITSAVDEVVHKKPDITPWEAVKSGITVGRAATGTITTTLLLAYSGSCIAQLMVFMAQGTPLDCILNYKYIAAELIHTVGGQLWNCCGCPRYGSGGRLSSCRAQGKEKNGIVILFQHMNNSIIRNDL